MPPVQKLLSTTDLGRANQALLLLTFRYTTRAHPNARNHAPRSAGPAGPVHPPSVPPSHRFGQKSSTVFVRSQRKRTHPSADLTEHGVSHSPEASPRATISATYQKIKPTPQNKIAPPSASSQPSKENRSSEESRATKHFGWTASILNPQFTRSDPKGTNRPPRGFSKETVRSPTQNQFVRSTLGHTTQHTTNSR